MKKILISFPIAVLLLFSFFNSKVFAQDLIRMQVKENRADCTGVGPMKCLLVKFKHSKDWEFFYSGIDGFSYQEGYRYKLLVNKKERENVPADASAYTYELVKILKQRKKKMPKENLPSPVNFLAKYQWKLIQLNGRLIEESPIHMLFDKEKGTVSGNSGCNNFFGPFKIAGDKISFEKLGSTRMACAPEKNKLENEFLTVLRNNNLRFDIAEQTFNIYHGDKLVAMFGLDFKGK